MKDSDVIIETLNPKNVIPDKLKPGNRLGTKVIAVIGGCGDWAAYNGDIDWSDDYVAKHGTKIPREAAERLFIAPVIAGLHYRGI